MQFLQVPVEPGSDGKAVEVHGSAIGQLLLDGVPAKTRLSAGHHFIHQPALEEVAEKIRSGDRFPEHKGVRAHVAFGRLPHRQQRAGADPKPDLRHLRMHLPQHASRRGQVGQPVRNGKFRERSGGITTAARIEAQHRRSVRRQHAASLGKCAVTSLAFLDERWHNQYRLHNP